MQKLISIQHTKHQYKKGNQKFREQTWYRHRLKNDPQGRNLLKL
jgi:hypothetical protein